MNHGLSSATVDRICQVLASFPAIDKATLFGSRAKGTHKPGSDIDLTLHGDGLTPTLLTEVAEALDDLLLPYTIDLSIHETLNHAALQEHIGRVGKVFYEWKMLEIEGIVRPI